MKMIALSPRRNELSLHRKKSELECRFCTADEEKYYPVLGEHLSSVSHAIFYFTMHAFIDRKHLYTTWYGIVKNLM